ncbi:hypothetical protein [uncultured Mobiluncus sp.]|uniref:hypothetical protein n=1 Tax=uncultured Mobiluncus sp. TaxID=293425 RepID=UPI00261282E4|nr:hypothetical protein [uncultured Mobiluncus sp.]
MTKWIDSSDFSHIPKCTCGWTGGLELSKERAYTALMKHEARAHPGRRTARIAAMNWKARHDTRHAGRTVKSNGHPPR